MRATQEPLSFVNRYRGAVFQLCALFALTIACSDEASEVQNSTGGQATGGVSGAGGTQAAGNGGVPTAGSGALGGASVGGAQVAGSAQGGSATGGAGGSATGGGVTAGSTSGGAGSGGQAATGGASTGGLSTGGASAGGGGVSAGGGSSGAAGGTSMPCPTGGWTPGDQRITLMHGGVARVYEVHVPPGYTGTTRVPLMMTIHGAHNTINLVKGWSQMNPVADANGFIVVYPQGLDCWNSGGILPGCTAADDDVGFLTTVVSDVESHACIDPKRVYATGISNGAMMAQHMGCVKADIFASVGGIAGPSGSCNPSRPISVAYFHGTEDQTVGFSSAAPNARGWAMRNGCGTTPVETYNMGSTRCETYQGCREGVEVVFCTITGMGHCWPEDSRCGPGGGPEFAVTDFKASPFMWEFFKRHPLP